MALKSDFADGAAPLGSEALPGAAGPKALGIPGAKKTVYGKLPDAASDLAGDYEKLLPFMEFDLKKGAVGILSGGWHIVFKGKEKIPPGIEPVWPDRFDPEFRRGVFGAWKSAKESGNPPESLMIDLFGEDFESVLEKEAAADSAPEKKRSVS